MRPLFKVGKIAITRLSLGLSQQNQQNFQGHENSLGQKISTYNSFGHTLMHAHT